MPFLAVEKHSYAVLTKRDVEVKISLYLNFLQQNAFAFFSLTSRKNGEQFCVKKFDIRNHYIVYNDRIRIENLFFSVWKVA